MQKLNKRLYEDCIVKNIVEMILTKAIKKKIKLKDIREFIENEFDNTVNEILKNE